MNIEIGTYSPEHGVVCQFEENSEINIFYEHEAVTIRANNKGLISLACHLLTLAQSDVPSYAHFHFDDMNSLETGSIELIFAKLESR